MLLDPGLKCYNKTKTECSVRILKQHSYYYYYTTGIILKQLLLDLEITEMLKPDFVNIYEQHKHNRIHNRIHSLYGFDTHCH